MTGARTVSACSMAEMPSRARVGDAVLSLVDPGTAVGHPPGTCGHMILRFHDVEDAGEGLAAPCMGHVEAILAFAGRADADLLIHCHAGISRSPAAACIVAASRGSVAAARAFLDGHGDCMPNALMIRLGDAALGLGGALVRMVEAYDREVGRRMIGQPTF